MGKIALAWRIAQLCTGGDDWAGFEVEVFEGSA